MSDYSEMLIRGKLYPIAERHIEGRLRDRLAIDRSYRLMARWNGEKRRPKKGEFYLSGAIIEAHEAYNDLDTEYYIAEIVKGVEITAWSDVSPVEVNR